MQNKRTRTYLGTPFEKKLLCLLFTAAILPAACVAFSIYYLIFDTLKMQMSLPGVIGCNLAPVFLKVNFVITVAIPIILVLIWLAALKLTHRIAGPLYRIEKDLEEILAGEKTDLIQLRPKDELHSLVAKLNKVLSQRKAS